MRIRRLFSDREAYILGFTDGAKFILRDSLKEVTKTPVKYNGKAIDKMLDYTEEMEDKLPEIAEEWRSYSIADTLDNLKEFGIDDYKVFPDGAVSISGDLENKELIRKLSDLFTVINKEEDDQEGIFYLTVRQKEFGDHEPPKQGNRSPGNREIVPPSIVKKVKEGEGVIYEYNGSWRIVSMKTNPPTFWNSHYKTRENAEAALKAYQSSKN